MAGTVESSDFKTIVTGPNTFDIVAAHSVLAPGVPKEVTAKVTLKNGIELSKDKFIIKPAQTVGKAVLSKAAATLYKGASFTGDTIGIKLTTPANAKIGAVRLDPKSLTDLKFMTVEGEVANGFRIEQSGTDNWTVYFDADGYPPVPATLGSSTAKDLKASYTVKLEVWAVGTYVADSKGNFISAVDNAKPTVVPLKINIK